MTPPARTTIRPLTGVRFWAAFMVLSFHIIGPALPQDGGFLTHLVRHGSFGVDLFFILSGFILQHVYGGVFEGGADRRSYLSFLAFRLARIYPAHIATLGVMLALYGVGAVFYHRFPPDIASYGLWPLAQNMLLVQAWFDTPSPNIPAWSVSAEWFMYLLYPAVAMALVRLAAPATALLLALCLIAAQGVGGLHPLVHIAPEFLFGAALYRLDRRIALRARLGPWVGWLSLAALLLALGMEWPPRALVLLLCGVLLLALAGERDALGRVLSDRLPLYLGEISYSLYLVHSPVLNITRNFCRIYAPSVDIFSAPVVAAGVALSLGAAAALYRWVEAPARRALRHAAVRATGA